MPDDTNSNFDSPLVLIGLLNNQKKKELEIRVSDFDINTPIDVQEIPIS